MAISLCVCLADAPTTGDLVRARPDSRPSECPSAPTLRDLPVETRHDRLNPRVAKFQQSDRRLCHRRRHMAGRHRRHALPIAEDHHEHRPLVRASMIRSDFRSPRRDLVSATGGSRKSNDGDPGTSPKLAYSGDASLLRNPRRMADRGRLRT